MVAMAGMRSTTMFNNGEVPVRSSLISWIWTKDVLKSIAKLEEVPVALCGERTIPIDTKDSPRQKKGDSQQTNKIRWMDAYTGA